MKSLGLTSRSAAWLGSRRLSSIMLIAASTLLFALLAGLLSFLLIQDVLTFGRFPPGVSIVGVNVAGLSRTEAVKRCREELADIAGRPLTLKVDEELYQIAPEEIGLSLEYDEMVDKAYERAWGVPLYERMARRFMDRPKKVNVSLMTENNDELVRAFVERSLASVNREPQDAYVDVTGGAPVIVPAKDGRQTDFEQLLAATKEALGTPERTVDVRAERTQAAIADSAFGKLIIINLSAHSLSLYNREQLLAQYPIACGSASWPTPVGIWKVIEKQRNPSWRNPGTSWARSMPAYIPPGPGNPLGTRALALNASGVLIHGTSASWSIGRSVSHGCIRMHMRDVEALFEMVDAGVLVYIIRAPGDPGFDVTRKPVWSNWTPYP